MPVSHAVVNTPIHSDHAQDSEALIRRALNLVAYRFLKDKETARHASLELEDCGLAIGLSSTHLGFKNFPSILKLSTHALLVKTCVPFLNLVVAGRVSDMEGISGESPGKVVLTAASLLSAPQSCLRLDQVRDALTDTHVLHWSGWQVNPESTVFNMKSYIERTLLALAELNCQAQVSVTPIHPPRFPQ